MQVVQAIQFAVGLHEIRSQADGLSEQHRGDKRRDRSANEERRGKCQESAYLLSCDNLDEFAGSHSLAERRFWEQAA